VFESEFRGPGLVSQNDYGDKVNFICFFFLILRMIIPMKFLNIKNLKYL